MVLWNMYLFLVLFCGLCILQGLLVVDCADPVQSTTEGNLELDGSFRDLYSNETLYINVVGGTTKLHKQFVHALVGSPISIDQHLHVLPDLKCSLYVVENSLAIDHADLAICFVEEEIASNEETVVCRLADAVRSLRFSQPKAPLIIAYSGPATSISRLELLLRDAWLLADSRDNRLTSLYDSVDVQIVILPQQLQHKSTLSATTLKAITDLLQGILPFARHLDHVKTPLRVKMVEINQLSSKLPTIASIGLSKQVDEAALQVALVAANSSIARLNKLEGTNMFASLVEEFIQLGHKHLRENYENTVPAHLLALKNRELSSQVLEKLEPFFKRQMRLIRMQVAQEFNAEVVDNLDITVHVMKDLEDIRNRALRKFEQSAMQLMPPSAKAIKFWNADYDIMEFRQTLDEYLQGREAGFKVSGVVSRGGRIPIELSLHTWFSNPLGKDYRQDVLSNGKFDELIFDEAIEKVGTEFTTVGALSVRKQLKEKILGMELDRAKGHIFGRSGLTKLKSQSEFAREMVMFPLSVKSPDVALNGARQKKKGGKSILQKDSERVNFGPERFVRWDIKPMDEVKRSLDEVQAEITNNVKFATKRPGSTDVDWLSYVDKVLSVVPILNKGYCQPSIVNYGNRYTP